MPTVAIQKPVAAALINENLVIEWTANDADGDNLLFTVQYSDDSGAHWHTLINDFPASPTGMNRLALADLGSLPGSNGQTAQIRVIASDGYNTAVADSALFSVPNRPPQPAILSPVNGQSFAAALPIPLSGSATDPENGGLADNALTWTVDSKPAGTGANLVAAGLGSGSHTARLSATDGNSSAVISATFEIAPLGIPAVSAPALDGFCTDAAYADAVRVPLAAYSDSEPATAYLLRTNSHLWVCFVNLKKGSVNAGSNVGLRVDVNQSGDALAQAGDYGFFAGEDGDVFTTAGDGAGGFTMPGPGGLVAQVSSATNGWTAELRIDAAVIGGLDHLIGVNLSHDNVSAANDTYGWPFAATQNSPRSWSAATLGTLPTITALDRYTATVGSSSFTLAVMGSDFISGTVVLWNGAPLSTTFASSEHLSATVSISQLANTANVTVSAQSPAPANFESNGLPFEVIALPPVINSLSPSHVAAGSQTTTLTVNGQRFAANAQVLWKGNPLPTTFVSSGQLTAQIDAALLSDGGSAGVAVRNPTPQEQISSAMPFEVDPHTAVIYLPAVLR